MTEEAVSSAWKCDDHTHFPFHQITLTALERERDGPRYPGYRMPTGDASCAGIMAADVSLEQGTIRTDGRTTLMGSSAVQHLEQMTADVVVMAKARCSP